MKNVTISMDEELVRLTRTEAAKAGKSLSRYLSDAAREKLKRDEEEQAGPNRQSEALERILSGPMWDVTKVGRMPTSDERNARR